MTDLGSGTKTVHTFADAEYELVVGASEVTRAGDGSGCVERKGVFEVYACHQRTFAVRPGSITDDLEFPELRRGLEIRGGDVNVSM